MTVAKSKNTLKMYVKMAMCNLSIYCSFARAIIESEVCIFDIQIFFLLDSIPFLTGGGGGGCFFRIVRMTACNTN